MRVDHYAYQRATRVAGVGFLVQLGIGLTLLIFSLVGGAATPQDTAFLYGSLYVLLGALAWLGLIIVFNQQKLERLEALETDELARTRGADAGGSMFGDAADEQRVAARRLLLMHKWLMPGLSLALAAVLGFVAWRMLAHMDLVAAKEAPFRRTEHIGWAVAICLAFSAASFIVSRFVAGMAKQPAWQNLRGGAAYMVGNSLVTLAIAVGIGFRFFGKDGVIEGVAWAIPIFMVVLAAEIVLNFVLNLYRPCVPGEMPRPAFDSKVLSMLSAPDNLVRSINEAVNYQFGFDITSSWGYQLLLRSVAWLLGIGVGVLVLLNTMVIVEPHEQGVKLSRGAIVGTEAHGPGILWKLPWPFQSADVHDVTTVRSLYLTPRPARDLAVHLWSTELKDQYETAPRPFMVAPSRNVGPAVRTSNTSDGADDASAERASRLASLVDAEIELHWHIRADDNGLLDHLRFAPPEVRPRETLSIREQALRDLALREIGQVFTEMTLPEVLSERRADLADLLARRVQIAFDAARTGVEVVAISIPMVRPAGGVAGTYIEYSVMNQQRQQLIARAQQDVVTTFASLLGGMSQAEEILAEIDAWTALRETAGSEAPAAVAQRQKVENMIVAAGGGLAIQIAQAERDRWVTQMNARADANRIAGQQMSYDAAPRLYRERETMKVYARALRDLNKYILGIDPARVRFDFELKELSPFFNLGDALKGDEGVPGL